jgi:hypothetical protein
MFIATGAVILLLAVVFWLAYPLTTYAPGYTRAGFRKIRVGMSAQEVRQLVGEPFSRLETRPLNTVWVYSRDAEGRFLDLGFQDCWVLISNNVVLLARDSWYFP